MGRRFGESHYINDYGSNLHATGVVSYQAVPFIFAGVVLTSCYSLVSFSSIETKPNPPEEGCESTSIVENTINLSEKLSGDINSFLRSTKGYKRTIFRKIAQDIKCSGNEDLNPEFIFAEKGKYIELVARFEKEYKDIKCVGIIDTAE